VPIAPKRNRKMKRRLKNLRMKTITRKISRRLYHAGVAGNSTRQLRSISARETADEMKRPLRPEDDLRHAHFHVIKLNHG